MRAGEAMSEELVIGAGIAFHYGSMEKGICLDALTYGGILLML